MEHFFEDYRGRIIRLSDERVRHIKEHFELKEFEIHVRETLLVPEMVVRSNQDPGVPLFYRYYFGTHIGDKWLCIVVKEDENGPFVLTAYFTNKIRNGEVLWKNM